MQRYPVSVITIIVELDDETYHTQIEANHLYDLSLGLTTCWRRIGTELDEEDSKTNAPFYSPTEM